jgi:hypothetical protein
VVLIAEIADSTARGDLGEKALLYASHAIPEYWVVDLPSRLLHLLWTPGPTAMPSIAGSSWASVSKRRR